MGSAVEAYYAIMARVVSEVATAYPSLPILYDNFSDPPDSDTLHLSVTVVQGETMQVSSSTWRTRGIVFFQIYQPVGRGTKEAMDLADFISSKFRRVSDGGVTFIAADVVPVGADGPYWGVNVKSRYYSDETVTG